MTRTNREVYLFFDLLSHDPRREMRAQCAPSAAWPEHVRALAARSAGALKACSRSSIGGGAEGMLQCDKISSTHGLAAMTSAEGRQLDPGALKACCHVTISAALMV